MVPALHPAAAAGPHRAAVTARAEAPRPAITQGSLGDASASLQEAVRAAQPKSETVPLCCYHWHFGYSLALDGDYALLGAPGDHKNKGSAYIWFRSGPDWTPLWKLKPVLPDHGDKFGTAVALDGDLYIVGAEYDDTPAGMDAGSVYVFLRSGTTWSLEAQLTAPDAAAGDRFGSSLALDGNTLLVGAEYDDTAAGVDAGSVYAIVRSGTTWTLQEKIVATDGAAGDRFGTAVDVGGDTGLVGSGLDDTAGGMDAGSAYVLVRSGTDWAEQAKLVAPAGAAGDRLGFSVALSGDTALLGAYFDDTAAGANAGSAYVFVRSGTTWSEQAHLLAPDGEAGDRFGISVAVDGDTALIGADYDTTPLGGFSAGSAWVAVRSGTTWAPQTQLVAPDGGGGDRFGFSVDVQGNTALVGAVVDDIPNGLFGGTAYVYFRTGTTWRLQAHMSPVAAPFGNQFGFAVALDGNTAVVGAYNENTPAGTNAGATYIFVRDGTEWSLQARITAPDGTSGARFGRAVAIDGDSVLVGAMFQDTPAGDGAGSAYVFVRSGVDWTHQATLTAFDAYQNDRFGRAVAIDGDTLVVGADTDATPGGNDAGSAHVYVRSGTVWTLQEHLLASDGDDFDHFGYSVDVEGDTVAVGAEDDDISGMTDVGSAYVYVRTGTDWTEQAHLMAPDGLALDRLGFSVALSGETLAVAAFLDDTPVGTDAGSVYMYVRSGTEWTQQAHLMASDGAAGDQFGRKVSLEGDTLAVGAYFDDTDFGPDAGSAYVFVRSGIDWTQQEQVFASDSAPGDQFGSSVDVSGDTVLVGASGANDPAGYEVGAGYVYTRNGSDWTEQAKLTSY